jgi:hypothetical protein
MVVAIVIIAATILYLYNPTEVAIYPRCPLKMLTGYDCPGCGTLRALHALFRGNLGVAWHYNPALFFAVPIIVFFSFSRQYRRGTLAKRIVESRITPWVIFVAIVLWWICRNL